MKNNYNKASVVKLKFENMDKMTVMKDCYFTSPFKIIKPFKKEHGFLNTMIMSSSAGIMAGDRQEFDVVVGERCNVEISSQSYEKIHRMNEGEAKRETLLTVDKDATLVYMPQPTIPFEKSAFESKTKVSLQDKTSRFIYAEVLTSGRVHSGESFLYNYYKNLLEVFCENEIIYKDNAYFNPSEFDITGFGMYEGFTHLASMFICNFSNSTRRVELIREYLECIGEEIEFGVSETASGDLSVRILGRSADKLEQIIKRIGEKMLEG